MFEQCLTGAAKAGMPGAQSGPVPVIRMYGVTMEGHSVLAHIHGFHPHFYVKAPINFQLGDCLDFKVCEESEIALETHLSHIVLLFNFKL